jgi:putative transposase
MTFAWIRVHAAQFTVKRMCQLLHVSRSGYYAWRDRVPSQRRLRHQTLARQVRSAHAESRRAYGSPRVAAELQAWGVNICVNTVARLMREEGLKARKKRRFVPRTSDGRHDYPIAPNRLDRRFGAGTDSDALAAAPNRVWAGDLTYLRTQKGWLYLWVVLDLFSRKVVGWSMTDHLRADGAVDALSMALRQRRPDGELLHHSDRGVQYACEDYRELLRKHGVTASMSRSGNCYDNAVAESFFSTLKTEWTDASSQVSADQARNSLFEWIEVFYNRQRRHSSLNYLSPEAFEAQIT